MCGSFYCYQAVGFVESGYWKCESRIKTEWRDYGKMGSMASKQWWLAENQTGTPEY